jgi:hypothetical protein
MWLLIFGFLIASLGVAFNFTIVLAIFGIPMVIVGVIMIIIGLIRMGTSKTTSNVEKLTEVIQQTVNMQAAASTGAAAAPASIADDKWTALITYDPDIKNAFEIAMVRGQGAVAFLRDVYAKVDNKAALPNIIADIKGKFPVLDLDTFQNAMIIPQVVEVQGLYQAEYEFRGERFLAARTANIARDEWIKANPADVDAESAKKRYEAALLL